MEKAEQIGVPVLNAENIDEMLGGKKYFTHTIMTDPARLVKILEAGEMHSSKKSGLASMTYESDKLIGMDDNVFLAMGKGYMRKDTYGIIFDAEALAKIPGASFVEDDLMNMEEEVIEQFLEMHKEEMIETIAQKRDVLKKLFEQKVLYAFQGGHGIYEKYFGENGQDRIQEFLNAIEAKGFSGISTEKEVVDQFTIERDTILGEQIMPSNLREELKMILQEKVVKPHTITGEKEIQDAVSRCWEADSKSYKQFLTGEQRVPKKVTEMRIANELDIKKALVAIFAPSN